jgi:hypothetical protein
MISIIHFISAKRRLKESKKTIYMMGGELECPPPILAQRDMIELEVQYYKEEAYRFVIGTIFVFAIILICSLF